MKKFTINSIIFLTIIAVIFGWNVYYLIRLNDSIRKDVEREVMTAIADADIDDLICRAVMAESLTTSAMMAEQAEQSSSPRQVEGSTYLDQKRQRISIRTEVDGSVVEEKSMATESEAFANQMVDAMSKQFHNIMDKYLPYDPAVMDSVLMLQLNRRFIYPEVVRVEVVNEADSVICENPEIVDIKGLDTFKFMINPTENLYYKVYMTPLTRHILSQTKGVITTIFLLMLAFAAAFWYLFHTVSRLRTVEEMKDDFINNMTHELKTPISIAYSANDALLNYDTANDPEKKTAYLTIAIKQLRRLGELVENILAVSMERRKTMTLNREIVFLPQLIKEIAEAQRMRGDKEITIDVKAEGDVNVTADKTHLTNVLNNLIDNAIKYSGETVSIQININSDGIEISDNGIGIPQKSIPYLFDKFYRVPHGNRLDVRGYGIGLYYVQQILGKMGWSISVRSRENVGSVFTIKFNDHETQDTVCGG